MNITENIQRVHERIHHAAVSSNRSPDEITLIGVTKTVSPTQIMEAFEAGIENFGENRVQELIGKYDEIDKRVNWHLIGSLQTNKVKYIIDKVELIHSLDRIGLAQEIEKRAAQIEKKVPVLVQVNISGERTKSGIDPDDALDFIQSLKQYPHVHVQGLMTIAPLEGDVDTNRTYFRGMKKLFEQIKQQNIRHAEMHYLSMGMTNDFDIAIEEGANMVRIGRAIFGERKINNRVQPF